MKKVNILIPAALQAIRHKETGILLSDGVSILKEYDGYTASFAPSVITAGLKATLSFYSDKHKSTNDAADKTRRHHILQLLLKIYKSKYLLEEGGLAGDDLLEMAIKTAHGSTGERALKKDLIEAATALKLAMRNFRQAENAQDLFIPKTVEA